MSCGRRPILRDAPKSALPNVLSASSRCQVDHPVERARYSGMVFLQLKFMRLGGSACSRLTFSRISSAGL